MRVRSVLARDLSQVNEIEEASFATPWSPRTFENLLRRDNAKLFAAVDAEDDSRVLGYAAVWFAGGQGELGDLAVHPDVRRAGIGSRLVEAVLEDARGRGLQELFLEVRQGNLSAQALYRRHGFEVVGRRRGYYRDPVEDALVMRRLLAR